MKKKELKRRKKWREKSIATWVLIIVQSWKKRRVQCSSFRANPWWVGTPSSVWWNFHNQQRLCKQKKLILMRWISLLVLMIKQPNKKLLQKEKNVQGSHLCMSTNYLRCFSTFLHLSRENPTRLCNKSFKEKHTNIANWCHKWQNNTI